ncbi:MAG: response regulator [Bacteroidales bacterium]|nr:response regulator [Bacteroidales bacterium]
MEKSIIILDDDKAQAKGLSEALGKVLVDYSFEAYYEEVHMIDAIENRFYTLAIVDIRMDKFHFNGIDLVKRIFEVNPFAKVLIISAFKDEYFLTIKDILLSGKVIDVIEKQPLSEWLPALKGIIEKYFSELDKDPSEINKALLKYYADAKNETDIYKKGVLFEHFVSLIFQSFGYNEINKRVKDKSLNEVDLIIRNETNDIFLGKFGKYILIECKNKPDSKVSKNDFILFSAKLQNTSGLSELGIIATTGYIARTTYIEAVRTSASAKKILFLSNPEFEQLISAKDKKEEFKRIIDSQVKDN